MTKLYQIGKEIAQGLVDGMSSMVKKTTVKIRNKANKDNFPPSYHISKIGKPTSTGWGERKVGLDKKKN
jgi:hypothetical protein